MHLFIIGTGGRSFCIGASYSKCYWLSVSKVYAVVAGRNAIGFNDFIWAHGSMLSANALWSRRKQVEFDMKILFWWLERVRFPNLYAQCINLGGTCLCCTTNWCIKELCLLFLRVVLLSLSRFVRDESVKSEAIQVAKCFSRFGSLQQFFALIPPARKYSW